MRKKKRITAEDFGSGWEQHILAQNHPHRLILYVNIFTNKVVYKVEKGIDFISSSGSFERALSDYNEVTQ
jgi:hypothetical protein